MTSTRYYTPEKLGRRCGVCKLRMPLALVHAGIYVHPTCAEESTP